MEFLNVLLAEAAKSEMDPSQVTASDVSTYVREVKRALKGKQMTKRSVASTIRGIVEDDPKFGANPGAVSKLVAAVCAKVCESFADDAELLEAFADNDQGVMYVAEGEDEDDSTQPAKFSASTPAKELKAQAAYLKKQLEEHKDNRVMYIKLKQALKKIEGFLSKQVTEGQLSPRAEQALLAKLNEAERVDVDDLSVPEIEAKLLAAAKAGHPDVKGMKVHADDKMMRVEVPGQDRCYATLSLTTGVINVLKEGWDGEEEEEQEAPAAKKEAPKKAVSPRAKAALAKKAEKSTKAVEESAVIPEVPTEEVAPVAKKSFLQSVFAQKGIE